MQGWRENKLLRREDECVEGITRSEQGREEGALRIEKGKKERRTYLTVAKAASADV